MSLKGSSTSNIEGLGPPFAYQDGALSSLGISQTKLQVEVFGRRKSGPPSSTHCTRTNSRKYKIRFLLYKLRSKLKTVAPI